jgi:hypothetical protein
MARIGGRNAAVAGCGLLAVLAAVGSIVLATPRTVQEERPAVVEAARIRKTPAAVAARGRYPREEWFVRDLYGRLMRYDFAAREFHHIETGAPTPPADYLLITLRDIRTEAWTGQGDLGVSPPGGNALTIQRQALCKGDDPCHAYYDVAWSRVPPADRRQDPPISGSASRYTRYSVTLTLGGSSRTYEAAVVYHDDSDGVTATPEVIDPVIPDLDAVAGDRAPLARAPWHLYTKTRRYAAVAVKARDWHSNPRSRALSVPIGYIVGDDVTPGDEQIVAMSSESCQPTITIQGDNTVWYLNGETPAGYATSVSLTSSGGASTQWTIVAGSDKVRLSTTTGQSTTVTSTGTAFSTSAGDILLRASASGASSPDFAMMTRTPHRLQAGTITTTCPEPTWGYVTRLRYTVQDQLLTTLPSSVPLNERWSSGGLCLAGQCIAGTVRRLGGTMGSGAVSSVTKTSVASRPR